MFRTCIMRSNRLCALCWFRPCHDQWDGMLLCCSKRQFTKRGSFLEIRNTVQIREKISFLYGCGKKDHVQLQLHRVLFDTNCQDVQHGTFFKLSYYLMPLFRSSRSTVSKTCELLHYWSQVETQFHYKFISISLQ